MLIALSVFQLSPHACDLPEPGAQRAGKYPEHPKTLDPLQLVCLLDLFAILLVGTGLVLGLNPGFILAAFICFYGFAIVDGQGPIQSFREPVARLARKPSTGIFDPLHDIASLLLNSPIFLGLDLALDIVATIALAIVYDTMRSVKR